MTTHDATLAAAGGGFDQARFRQVLGHFASGVTVVTAMEEGLPVGFTCQAFTSLSLDPPLVALAPAKSSTSWPRIAKAGGLLREHPEPTARRSSAGASPSRGATSSPVSAWHVGVAGTPVIDGSLAWIECKLEIVHDAGDHELVVGKALALGLGEGRPLIFHRGRLRHRDRVSGYRLGTVPKILPSTAIDDVIVVEPEAHGDARGRFVETYRRTWFPLGREMVQGNRSEKQAGAVVGLHYHLHQADYWYLLRGRARVVLHDLRAGLAD